MVNNLDNLSKEIDLLLNNFWITKEENKEDYYLLKRKQPELRKFISKNLGCKLIVHDRFIKLEKQTTIPSKDQGIEEFSSTMDYVLLFIFLLYLEDKPKGEKFILSQLIEYVKTTAITLELSNIPNWTYASDRKSLIRVIKYLVSHNVIIIKDEDKISFQDDEQADALYEVSGISNYLVPAFDYDIHSLKTPEDFIEMEWKNQDTEHGDIRRYKVYRNLLFLPAIHRENITDSEDEYLRKMHKTIEKELQDNCDLYTEITKNMAFVYADENTIQKEYFPNTKRITDIILLINKALAEYIEENKIEKTKEENFIISKEILKEILLTTRKEKESYFSKAYLDLPGDKYIKEIITTMENFHFIKENKETNTYTIYPLIYRFVGKIKEKEERKLTQIEIFGGDVNEL